MVNVWTSERPMPHIPTLHGLLHHEYSQNMWQCDIARHDGPDCNWTVALVDPHSDWFGGMVTAFNYPVYWFVGNADGITESGTIAAWPWEAVSCVRHIITCSVFRLARLQDTLEPYWTAPEGVSG